MRPAAVLLSLLVLRAPLGVPAQEPAAPRDAADLRAWVEAFEGLSFDPTRAGQVEGLTLVRDAGSFVLHRGALYLLQPVAGSVPGAVFVGEGQFTLDAPFAVEQAELRREFGGDKAVLPFRSAVFLFTDSTAAAWTDLLTGLPGTYGDPDREVEEALKYLVDDGVVAPSVMAPLVNREPGFFYAHFAWDRGDPRFFTFDPRQEEEVTLAVKSRRGRGRRTVASFPRVSFDAASAGAEGDDKDRVTVDHFDIETTVAGNLDVVGTATARVTAVRAPGGWIPFSLTADLEVDEVVWDDGTPVPFVRPKDAGHVWVYLGGAEDAATFPRILTFRYHGDILDRPRDLWVVFDSYRTWFPVPAFNRPASYRLTYRVPDDYVVSSVGTKLEERREGDEVVSVWETPAVHQVTFNLGGFEEFGSTGRPALRVHVNERAHRTLGALAAERNVFLLEQRDMAEAVALDLRRSFSFFGDVYGPTPVSDFLATEIPEFHGEAFPGLVLLSWQTFQWTGEAGFDEMFRAHEVAHQWWGIGVRPATYRDHWLAEGLAEFSGLWYTARVRGSVDLYNKRLQEIRDELLDRRDEARPIWLGYRVRDEEHPEDYQNVVYGKGAWVMHMLRMLLTDHDTGSDAVFVDFIRTFYRDHLGKAATTQDLRRTLEEKVGAGMGWFFDQWVYGTAIPTYRFSYTYEPAPDGLVKATIRVRQEGVPEDFSMIVPILLDFGEEGSAVVRVNVMGREVEAALPLLPREPDAIVFNAFDAVLAEVKNEDWRD